MRIIANVESDKVSVLSSQSDLAKQRPRKRRKLNSTSAESVCSQFSEAETTDSSSSGEEDGDICNDDCYSCREKSGNLKRKRSEQSNMKRTSMVQENEGRMSGGNRTFTPTYQGQQRAGENSAVTCRRYSQNTRFAQTDPDPSFVSLTSTEVETTFGFQCSQCSRHDTIVHVDTKEERYEERDIVRTPEMIQCAAPVTNQKPASIPFTEMPQNAHSHSGENENAKKSCFQPTKRAQVTCSPSGDSDQAKDRCAEYNANTPIMMDVSYEEKMQYRECESGNFTTNECTSDSEGSLEIPDDPCNQSTLCSQVNTDSGGFEYNPCDPWVETRGVGIQTRCGVQLGTQTEAINVEDKGCQRYLRQPKATQVNEEDCRRQHKETEVSWFDSCDSLLQQEPICNNPPQIEPCRLLQDSTNRPVCEFYTSPKPQALNPVLVPSPVQKCYRPNQPSPVSQMYSGVSQCEQPNIPPNPCQLLGNQTCCMVFDQDQSFGNLLLNIVKDELLVYWYIILFLIVLALLLWFYGPMLLQALYCYGLPLLFFLLLLMLIFWLSPGPEALQKKPCNFIKPQQEVSSPHSCLKVPDCSRAPSAIPRPPSNNPWVC